MSTLLLLEMVTSNPVLSLPLLSELMQRLLAVFLTVILLLATVNGVAAGPMVAPASTTLDSQTQHEAKPGFSTSSNGSLPIFTFQTSFSILVPCTMTPRIQPPAHQAPPVRTIIATPMENGTYPVILFKHGFNLANCFYTQLFEYLASSGYIVIAPQVLTLSSDCSREIDETAKMANWIVESLAGVLNEAMPSVSVVPNVSKLVMAGHSRGGKVAFALATGKMRATGLPSFSALVTLDPVDSMAADVVVIPQMVKAGCNHTDNTLSIPILILGTGYGGKRSGPFETGPPCAPASCSHEGYFNCSSSPLMYHFSALEYGHLDFLDDSNIWTSLVCASGISKVLLRNFSGRLIVAFLQATLEGNEEDMDYILKNWGEIDAIKLAEPQIYRADELSNAAFKNFKSHKI
ncbi:hypothetical protein L7F22_023191 [Adiantum nelumboides]|nr:hypothetical protein [Adiantum nelumboides]